MRPDLKKSGAFEAVFAEVVTHSKQGEDASDDNNGDAHQDVRGYDAQMIKPLLFSSFHVVLIIAQIV